MKIPQEELNSILIQFNPWWKGEQIPDLPGWHRSAFSELMDWVVSPPTHRAVLLTGARQVGKTTLILQSIEALIRQGVPPGNILYATFDHPICKLGGLNAVLNAWRECEPKREGLEYLFLDEAQFIKDIGTWIKHQVDFFKTRRIVFTGSATPLIETGQESGVGRWYTLHLSTLSFREYLLIKQIKLPAIPEISLLEELFHKEPHELLRMSEASRFLIGHFHEYLVRGGFPQTALMDSITGAQRLLREDIIEKVLKRDMTALFGVRRILELEELFIFLCMHDGGIHDIATISKELGIARQTVQNYLELLESTHLIYKVIPYGYGKEVLRGKSKLYMSDPGIAPSVLIKGKSILENATQLGGIVETAVVGHLFAFSAQKNARFSYWRSSKDKEIDIVMEAGEEITPFEVKYQSHSITRRDVPSLIEFMNEKKAVKRGYVLTKQTDDIGKLEEKIFRIPAALFCYWMSFNRAENDSRSSTTTAVAPKSKS